MEPNKVEKQIREKLNSREIQPSFQAWDRLDAMLSVQEKKPKKAVFPWLKIAAGFILFLGIAFVFLTQKENNNLIKGSETIVVESAVDTAEVIENNTVVVENETGIEVGEKVETVAVLKGKSSKKPSIQEFVSQSNDDKIQSSNTNIAEVKHEKIEEKQNTVIKNNAPISFENKEVIAEKTNISKPKLKVDANALLNQVEGEVTLTFRQKVMKTLTKNYKEAKESFASRNEESSSNQ